MLLEYNSSTISEKKEAVKMNELAVYRCEICGNMVVMIKSGGGTLTCCGQEMKKLEANTVDASKEKHVPDVKIEDGRIKVQVGSVEHPMVPEHYIEWIAAVSGRNVGMVYLKPGMKPKAEFMFIQNNDEEASADEIVPNCEGSPCNFVNKMQPQEKITVYEYCNLHGLWKAEK